MTEIHQLIGCPDIEHLRDMARRGTTECGRSTGAIYGFIEEAIDVEPMGATVRNLLEQMVLPSLEILASSERCKKWHEDKLAEDMQNATIENINREVDLLRGIATDSINGPHIFQGDEVAFAILEERVRHRHSMPESIFALLGFAALHVLKARILEQRKGEAARGAQKRMRGTRMPEAHTGQASFPF
jgi:hypothetical protein